MIPASEVISRIHATRETGKKSGLINTRELIDALECEPSVPVIHVAGTNGKGSICSICESILRHEGYRTGLYTSPFLQIYNERIRINGRPVEDDIISSAGTILFDTVDKLNSEHEHFFTPFELGTALALLVFKMEKVDIAVIEVGLGGRFDATNAIEHITVSAIGAIGLDHMQYLGNTLEEIAFEKAGIMKENTPVVCHPAEECVKKIFQNCAGQKKSILNQTSVDMITQVRADASGSTADFVLSGMEIRGLRISLPGKHQLTNTLTALGAIAELRKCGIRIGERAIREGCGNVFWPARLEWNNRVLIDGAHNVQGVTALADYAEEYLNGRKIVMLIGVLTEKLTADMIAQIRRIGNIAVTVTPDYAGRALPAEMLAEVLRDNGIVADPATSTEAGMEAAKLLAGDDGITVAFGSLYFVGRLRTVLGLMP